MNLSEFVKLTCWISLSVILWLALLGIVPSGFPLWFAFVFFLATLILVAAHGGQKR